MSKTWGVHRSLTSDPSLIGEVSSGRISKFDKIYLGKVKDNEDENAMGRLRVWIRELCGPDENNENNWYLLSYATAFGGVTPVTDGAQTSYGDWAVPPDLDVEVAVFFVNGDPSRGFWFASTIPEKMNQSMAGASTTDGETLMTEADRNNAGDSTNEDKLRPEDIMNERVMLQGLQTDQARGMSYSSPRRKGDDPERPNAPAKVYGRSSPAGHSMVMDDGRTSSVTGERVGSLIRIRTASGAQILMDDTEGFIYMITPDGKTWIEMTDQNGGNIDLYSAGNISMHASNDVNIKAGNEIKIEGTTGVNLWSEANMSLRANRNLNTVSVGETNMHSQIDFNLRSDTYVAVAAISGVHLSSDNVINFTSLGDTNLRVDGNANIDAAGTLNLKSTSTYVSTDADMNFLAGTDVFLESAGAMNILSPSDISLECVNFGITSDDTKISGIVSATNINSGSIDVSGSVVVSGSAVASGVVLNGTIPSGASPTAPLIPSAPIGAISAGEAGIALGASIPANNIKPISRVPDAEPWAMHTSRDGGGPFVLRGNGTQSGVPGSGWASSPSTGNLGSLSYFGQLSGGNIARMDEAQTRSYLGTLGYRESGNQYYIINSIGFVGKYQFGWAALYDIGYINNKNASNSMLADSSIWTGKNGATSRDAFLNQPETQELAIILYTNLNRKYMINDGIAMDSLPINEYSGLLMAAHLSGHASSAHYSKTGESFTDAYGTVNVEYYELGYAAMGYALDPSIIANVDTYTAAPRSHPIPNCVDLNDSPLLTGGGSSPDSQYITKELVVTLETIARHWGNKVLQINSGYRSPAYNEYLRTKNGGGAHNNWNGVAESSYHMQGIAADISMGSISPGNITNHYRDFIKVASHYGVGGIGVYSSFIHIDLANVRSWTPDFAPDILASPNGSHIKGRYKSFKEVASLTFNGTEYTPPTTTARITEENEGGAPV